MMTYVTELHASTASDGYCNNVMMLVGQRVVYIYVCIHDYLYRLSHPFLFEKTSADPSSRQLDDNLSTFISTFASISCSVSGRRVREMGLSPPLLAPFMVFAHFLFPSPTLLTPPLSSSLSSSALLPLPSSPCPPSILAFASPPNHPLEPSPLLPPLPPSCPKISLPPSLLANSDSPKTDALKNHRVLCGRGAATLVHKGAHTGADAHLRFAFP